MPEIIIDQETLKLLNEMGFIENPEKKNSYQIRIENGLAGITYDEKNPNGFRWAKVGGRFIKHDEIDKIPILKAFKERRDEIKNKLLQGIGASQSSNDGKQPESHDNKQDSQKTNVGGERILKKEEHTTPTTEEAKNLCPPTPIKEQQPIPPAASQSPNLYELFLELVGLGGIIEIFGDTGSLKTQASVEAAKGAISKGKAVYYLDTEGKVGISNKKVLGGAYKYLPIWEEILTTIKNLPKYDFLIIDSVGLPISAKYPTMKLNEQGDAWNDLMMLVGDYLKSWAYKNNALVVITNQPKSTFMKSEEELKRLDPLGDKVHFAPNLILRATKTIIPGHYDKDLKKVIPPKSIGTFISHRSTDFMDDIEILSIIKNDDEIEVKIPKYIIERLKKLKE